MDGRRLLSLRLGSLKVGQVDFAGKLTLKDALSVERQALNIVPERGVNHHQSVSMDVRPRHVSRRSLVF